LRGNHQEPLFGSSADRSVLNNIVGEAVTQFNCRIHAFCWMTNHLHALVQIADCPLGKVVRCVAGRYSRYRHKTLNTSGHLFERRHKAKLVDVDAYFLTLLRYIHRNPVKAGLVRHPSDYPWSSHRAFLGAETISWLTTDFGLSLFSSHVAQARIAYDRFIVETCDEDDDDLEQESHSEDCRILGTDDFIAKIPLTPYKPRSAVTLETFAASICSQNGVSVELLRSLSRARHLASIRVAFSIQAIEQRVANLCEVARFLNRDHSSLTRLLARHKANHEPR
jgi:REP element-mobilizing transposase RayT